MRCERAFKGLLMGLVLGVPMACFSLQVQAQTNDKSVESQLKFVAGDEKGNDSKALKTEILVSKSERLAMNQLQILINKHRGDSIEAELWFRMAELHMRRARTARFFELHRDSETVVHLAPKVTNNASERQSIQSAVQIYDKIQNEFRSFEEMDVVIFNDAFARQQLGQTKEAEVLYEKLVHVYPHSPLVPDCYLAIGEINYDRKDFKLALDNFLMIRKFPAARAYPYGLYKAAWAYFNLQDAASALSQLEHVVAFGKMIHDKGLESKLDLRREALNDMTFFFGDTYPSSKGVDYFVQQSGELPVEPTILRLGRMYHRHSKYNDVTVVYQDFLRKFPKSPAVHLVQNELILNFDILHQRPAAVAQMTRMRETCQQTSVAEAKRSGETTDDAKIMGADDKTCNELLVETSHNMASKWHALWLKDKSATEMAASAQRAYEIHLAAIPPSEETAKTRFSYAELLFQRGQYREASIQYGRVADATKTQQLRHDASHGALVSLEKATDDKWNDTDESSFKHTAEIYRKNSPDGPFMIDIDFKIGVIAYQKGHYDEAAPIFEKIGWKYRTVEKGQKAQDLYLDILNIKKDYPRLAQRSKELSGMATEPNRKSHLTKIYREAYFAQVQGFEDKGESPRAIAEYKKFAESNPDSELAPRAWWNATQLIYKSNNFMGGAESSYQYYKHFPKEKNAKEALVQAAQHFENMGQLLMAAAVLEDLAKEDAANSPKWLGLAADFYALSGRQEKARILYHQLASQTDKEQARTDLEKWAAMETAAGKNGSFDEVGKLMLERNIQPQASLVQLAKVESLYDQKSYKEAFNEAKKLVSSDAGSIYARAKARFIQAEVLDQEFRSQSLKASASHVAMVIALKTEKLDKMQRAYQAAVTYGDATVSVQATRKLASAYVHYAQSVRSVKLPAGTPKSEVQAFQKEIDSLALPIEDKAVDTLNDGLKAAKAAQLHDGSIADLQGDLNQLNQRAGSEVNVAIASPAIVVPTFIGGSGT